MVFIFFSWQPAMLTKASATKALNQFMSGLYHADLWIPRLQVVPIVQAGEHSLKAYNYLAWLSHEQGEPKFSYKPKLHMLHESVVYLQSRMLQWEQTRSNHLRFIGWSIQKPHVFIIETREKFWVRKAIILKRINRK